MVRRTSTKIMHDKLREELTRKVSLKMKEQHQKMSREILPTNLRRTSTPEVHSEIDMEDPMIQDIIMS